MPQLDFTIAFPQIFWLFINFFFIYVIFVHFFLPLFVKVLKSRKKIVELNNEVLLELQNKYAVKYQNLNLNLNKNITDIKLMLQTKFYPVFLFSKKKKLDFLDLKIAKVLFYNAIYFDEVIFNSIYMKSLNFNIK